MLVEEKIADLARRREKALAGGGEKKIAKQHADGKLTARERIELLLDEGTFIELDRYVAQRGVEFGLMGMDVPTDGVVTGYGLIHGRLTYLFAQDFTVLGGSLGEMHATKICKVMDMALQNGAPIIGINDSGGARIQEGVDSLHGYGRIFKRNAMASGVVPQLSLIMGPCAGGAVYSPALTDFVFMVDHSQMFITGPQVIKGVTGEDVSAEALGGAMTHNATSGDAHFYAANEAECMNQVRRLLSFIPSNNLEHPPQGPANDTPERLDERLNTLIPDDEHHPYDVKDIIVTIADNQDFFEVQPYYASNIVVGFIRLNGTSVGVIANQPKVAAGCLDMDAADKGARFIRFCDAFNIPLLTIVDTPGYLPGVAQEHGGIIRHGAKLLYAYSEAVVPKLTLLTKKAYGGAYVAMCSKALGADVAIAWPTAEIAVMGAAGATNIVFRKEINAAADPVAKRKEKVAEYEARFANPYPAAARGYVDMVIEPAHTRYYLIRSLDALLSKKESRPGRKHGNIPL